MAAGTNQETPAIEGYDPVAYFEENRAVPGKSEHQHEWGGQVWYFASEAHKSRFAADPEKYAPAYGGHCAFAVSLGKDPAPAGNPKSFRIVDGRLLFALNPVARFLFGILPGRLAKADEHWKKRD